MWSPAIFYKNRLQLLKNKFFKKKEEFCALKYGYCLMHGRTKRTLEYFEEERKTDYFNIALNISIPILIIHGDADMSVSCKNSIIFHKKSKNTKLLIIKGENHGFKNNDDNLDYACYETLKFIKDKLYFK